MPTHDFGRLSNVDFEELVRDLLSAEWGCRLESFKQGRDGGVDLRRIDADDGRTIIQCKHYLGSGFATLRSRLKNSELPKIERLAPDRYVLATSVPLSVGEKDELHVLLAPHVRDAGDILGGGEVEALLRKHPPVEKAHYKLWLASTAVLERIVHAAEHARTDLNVESMRRALPKFVRTGAYDRALEALERHRVVILSGAPGIGKSTLANVLLLEHLERGYVPAVVGDDLSEARRQVRPGQRTVFHFDDFLGQTHLGDRPDFLGRREDSSLVEFVEMVRSTPEYRFILTTREHILADALQRSERLRNAGIGDDRCVIEIGDYSREHRARILYQHLFFSDLPREFKEEMLLDDFFLRVVGHEHFNPRLIEWLSSHRRLGGVAPQDYRGHVSALLDDPRRIWSDAYRRQLSDAARTVLIALLSIGYWVAATDLDAAWRPLHEHRCRKYNIPSQPTAFREALKELDGSFLSYDRGWVRFLNPSVRDFLGGELADDHESVLDILATATRFRQVAAAWRHSGDRGRFPDMRGRFVSALGPLLEATRRLLRAEHLAPQRFGPVTVATTSDRNLPDRACMVVELADALRSVEAMATLRESVALVTAELDGVFTTVGEGSGVLGAMLDTVWLKHAGGWPILQPLVDAMVEALDGARAADWLSLFDLMKKGLDLGAAPEAAIETHYARYLRSGAGDERRNCGHVSEMAELLDALIRLRNEYGAGLAFEIGCLEGDIFEAEQQHSEDIASRPAERSPANDRRGIASDTELRDLFGGLLA